MRVHAQLIRAQDASHLWAETYDRNLDDIFSVESEVATAIAQKLQAKLTGSEQRALASKPTVNLDAYDAYLHGIEFDRRTESWADLLEAKRYLELAVVFIERLRWLGHGWEELKLTFTFRILTFVRRGLTRRAMPSKQPSVYSPVWVRVGWLRVTIIYIANAIVRWRRL